MTPGSTYRLQLHAGFTFRDAAALVPYLARLGITHAYTSPILRARPGSTHGYDIIDHNLFNPEIGSSEDFAHFVGELRRHEMGLIIDFVPNHMGIGTENHWWFDVLEWGEESVYAGYFDIDWHPIRPQMQGKVLVPFLGEHFGKAVADGSLRLAYEHPGGFRFSYGEHRFPVTPTTYAEILAESRNPELTVLAGDFKRLGLGTNGTTRAMGRELVQRLAELASEPAVQSDLATIVEEINADEVRLEHLIDGQRYRIAFWRVASDEINYRRFFDINALAALRMEDPACLADTHRLIFELIERGDVAGLRIDHVDGLFDPIGYCDLLRSRAELFGQDLYLVVEKILARHESLRARWRVDGTTGYEYAALVTNLLVDAEAEPRLDRIYRRFTREQRPFEAIAYECRQVIMRTALAGELNVLANHLDRIAQADPRSRDFTLFGLRAALEEIVASFPVYRTYLKAEEIAEDDRRDIDWAIGRARKRDETGEQSIYDFIYDVLTTVLSQDGAPLLRERVHFAMRFQQFTAPVAAKGVEDTAFYRYHRFDALNEVGSDPGHFGVSLAAFHRENADRSRRRPASMLATSTHDTKRGEDVRARLAVLSEMPGEWGHAVTRWAQLNTRRRTSVGALVAPDRNDEYFLYQTLVGAWPVESIEASLEAETLRPFLERVEEYVVKALREAKRHSSWANPNAAYEEGTLTFVRRILDVSRASPFLTDFRRFVGRIARFGLYNSLAQLVLRLAGPGVPDTYQGTELWDLTLVDPDNRRPVDFALRERWLDELEAEQGAGDPAALARELLAGWSDGRIKLYVLSRLLQWRRAHAGILDRGAYTPLESTGAHAEHLCAYRLGDAVVAVARLTKRLLGERPGDPTGSIWGDTALVTPAEMGSYTNVLTSAVVPATGEVAVAELLRDLPVAVLIPTPAR